MKRREFLRLAIGGLGSLSFPLDGWAWSFVPPSVGGGTAAEDPHFFLHILIPGGTDSLFLFDGRPKAMTQAGVMHDHLKEEPLLWKAVPATSQLSVNTRGPPKCGMLIS